MKFKDEETRDAFAAAANGHVPPCRNHEWRAGVYDDFYTCWRCDARWYGPFEAPAQPTGQRLK